MQNLSSRAIVRLFLTSPETFYVNKNCTLQFNDRVLFSYGKPIAFHDPLTNQFICTYYPEPFATGWAVRHLHEFQTQCPEAIRLPTLDATLNETVSFYTKEIARFSPIAKTHAELVHNFNTAKEYYARIGVHIFNQAEPMPRDYKKAPKDKLRTARETGTKPSYAEAIYHYTNNPTDYTSHGKLYSPHDRPELIYAGTVLARWYSAEFIGKHTGSSKPQPLFTIRAYDLRPKHIEFINQLIMHTTPSLTNLNRNLLVPEPQIDITDEAKMLASYAQRLDDLANILLNYERDTQTPRNVARRWAQIREHRENYIKLFHIPDINLPTFTPTAEQESYLKKFGAYRTA